MFRILSITFKLRVKHTIWAKYESELVYFGFDPSGKVQKNIYITQNINTHIWSIWNSLTWTVNCKLCYVEHVKYPTIKEYDFMLLSLLSSSFPSSLDVFLVLVIVEFQNSNSNSKLNYSWQFPFFLNMPNLFFAK